MNRIGLSAGFSFWKLGGAGSCGGSLRRVAEMFDWTSSAAPSMLRSRSNCMTILVTPRLEDDVIIVMPGIVAKARSSGPATEEAIESALAPGSAAFTTTVGKSTRGSAATGNCR